MKPVWMILALCLAGGSEAAPHRPAADGEVLERLPTPGPDRRELRELRGAVATHPDRPDLAFGLARRYIRQGRAEADPRWYGHAEAVLEPWLKAGAAHPEALLLRATIRQNRHAFGDALADLDAALAAKPRLSEAWLTRAAILEAQGDYPGALKSCLGVGRGSAAFAATVCLESALGLAGQAEAAYGRLAPMLAAAPDAEQRAWAGGILAELAERLDRAAEAEARYRAALREAPRSPYLLAAYADFLLDRGRPAEAAALLEGETRADPLLLRLALAEQALGIATFAEHASILKARFEASRARGDTSHQGDEARYALRISNEPARALALAEANWAVQREPRDARILLEAAAAAGHTDVAAEVAGFLARTGLEDARLRRLLAVAPGRQT